MSRSAGRPYSRFNKSLWLKTQGVCDDESKHAGARDHCGTVERLSGPSRPLGVAVFAVDADAKLAFALSCARFSPCVPAALTR
jgi:hypothetical protein